MYIDNLKKSLLRLKENLNLIIDSQVFPQQKLALSFESQIATAREIRNEFNRHINNCIEELGDLNSPLISYLENITNSLKLANECLTHYRPGSGPQLQIQVHKYMPESAVLTDLINEISATKIRKTIDDERVKSSIKAEQKETPPSKRLSAPKELGPLVDYRCTLKNTRIKHKILWVNKSLNPVADGSQPPSSSRLRVKL